MAKQIVGIVGLGVMGENLALNLESKGFSTAGFDWDDSKVRASPPRPRPSRPWPPTAWPSSSPACKARAGRILMTVPAGKPVDAVLTKLASALGKGDLVIDGGDSHYLDTARRITEFAPTGILTWEWG